VKVALTHPYSWPEVRRGAERIVVESARSVSARGHQVTVITAGETAGRQCRDGVTTLKLARRFDDAGHHERWFGRRIIPFLLRGRFDAVHSMMPFDALAAVRTKRLARHRVVFSDLGNPHRWYWEQSPDGAVRTELMRRVDVYGCMSNYSLDVLEQEWGRVGDLIPCGVRMSEFTPSPRRAARPTILFSGALDEPQKGLGDLLAACDLLLDGQPDLQVWLSGPGNADGLLAEATERVCQRVQVLPLGEPDEQGRRYAKAWVTALPSEGDSFGMVLVESLAAGTPIVVADDAAPPQLVTPTTGAISQLHDVPSLVKALEEGLALAGDAATAARCRDFARQFDWDEAIAPLLERLYQGTS
jgi:phosphatidylinositol alpha-mannosyltransferase